MDDLRMGALIPIHDRHLTIHQDDVGLRMLPSLCIANVVESLLAVPSRRNLEPEHGDELDGNPLVYRAVMPSVSHSNSADAGHHEVGNTYLSSTTRTWTLPRSDIESSPSLTDGIMTLGFFSAGASAGGVDGVARSSSLSFGR